MSWASISKEAEKHQKKNCVSHPQAKRVRKNQNSIRNLFLYTKPTIFRVVQATINDIYLIKLID